MIEPDLEDEDFGLDRICCGNCGKPFEEFGDLGCEQCDRRHPGFRPNIGGPKPANETAGSPKLAGWTNEMMSGIAASILAGLILFPTWAFIIGYRKMANWDREFTAWAYRPEQRKAWRLFSRAGDGWLYVLYYLWLRFGLLGAVVNRDSPLAHRLAAAVFLAWGISVALKLSFRRKRSPGYTRSDHGTIARFNWSFPSQHAACAIAFGMALWPNPTGLIFAGLVCVSRVLIGAHYVSDVLAGVGVGLLAWRLA